MKESIRYPVHDEISGYLYYDPTSTCTNYMSVSQNKGVNELLYIIYDYCWNRTKPEKDQSDDNPFHDKFFRGSTENFYQMKLDEPCLPKQFDGWNCGLGSVFSIMHFIRAFNNNKVSKDWITIHDEISRAIMPTFVFI